MKRKILVVASAGGHWHQACQITEALPAEDLFFVTTMNELPQRDGKTPFTIVTDCNKNTPFRFLLCAGQAILCLLRQRPDVVFSTGALPGFAFVMVAHVLRIRTIWVDSVANAEEPSLAGQKARRFSTLWLSQWSHVADQVGGRFEGSVL